MHWFNYSKGKGTGPPIRTFAGEFFFFSRFKSIDGFRHLLNQLTGNRYVCGVSGAGGREKLHTHITQGPGGGTARFGLLFPINLQCSARREAW